LFPPGKILVVVPTFCPRFLAINIFLFFLGTAFAPLTQPVAAGIAAATTWLASQWDNLRISGIQIWQSIMPQVTGIITGPYGSVARSALQRAASGGGSTTSVVTNLTQPPVAGRALSVATGSGADALANAARMGGQLYRANIPNALLSELQSIGLMTPIVLRG
jgi:hypothetical protein